MHCKTLNFTDFNVTCIEAPDFFYKKKAKYVYMSPHAVKNLIYTLRLIILTLFDGFRKDLKFNLKELV